MTGSTMPLIGRSSKGSATSRENPFLFAAMQTYNARKDVRSFSDVFVRVLLQRAGIQLQTLAPLRRKRMNEDCALALRKDGLQGDQEDGVIGYLLETDAADVPLEDRWGEEDAIELKDLLRKLGPADNNLTSEAFMRSFFRHLIFKGLQIGILDSSLNAFTRLTFLDISQNPLECIDVLPPNLTRLKAYNTNIRTLKCEPVQSLLFLGLGHSPFGNSGLVEVVDRFPGLLVLDLSYTEICNMERAISSLDRLPKLKQLYLAGCPLSLIPHLRLRLIAALHSLQTPGASIDAAAIPDSEVEDARKLRLPSGCARPEIVRLQVKLLMLEKARVLLDPPLKRLLAKKAVAKAIAAGTASKMAIEASVLAAEVAKTAEMAAGELDPKAKKGAPGAAEAAAAAEARAAAEAASTDASNASVEAVRAIVAAGRANGEPVAVYARAAAEAIEAAARAAGKSETEISEKKAEANRKAASQSFASEVSPGTAESEDVIAQAMTMGYSRKYPCGIRFEFELPGGRTASTTEVGLTPDLAQTSAAGVSFDSLDLSLLTGSDATPLHFEVDVSESPTGNLSEDRLLGLTNWLRGGFRVGILFQEGAEATPQELAAYAEVLAAAASAKAKGKAAAAPPKASAVSSAPDAQANVIAEERSRPDTVAIGGAVAAMDSFLRHGSALSTVTDNERMAGELSMLPTTPWVEQLDVRMVPIHRWLEPNIQVPSADKLLKKPWGSPGKPQAAKLKLEVTVYAPGAPKTDAVAEEGTT